MNRRKFSRAAASLALGVPALGKAAFAEQAPAQEPAPAALATPKYGMSKEQEDRVKQAIERGERGRATQRERKLGYEAEPSFVFRARVKGK